MRRRRIALAAVAILLGAAGCGSDDDDEAGTDTTVATTGEGAGAGATTAAQAGGSIAVKAADFAFEPTEIALQAGQPVTFSIENADDVRHSLTIDGLDVDQDVEGGKTAEAEATPAAGTYEFRCKYHSQMKGTITVT